jgi:hypothetical protein
MPTMMKKGYQLTLELVNLDNVVHLAANNVLAAPCPNAGGADTVQFAGLGLAHARLNGSHYLLL